VHTRDRMVKEYRELLNEKTQEFREKLYDNPEYLEVGSWIRKNEQVMKNLAIEVRNQVRSMEHTSGIRERYPDYVPIEKDTALFISLRWRCLVEVQNAFIHRDDDF